MKANCQICGVAFHGSARTANARRYNLCQGCYDAEVRFIGRDCPNCGTRHLDFIGSDHDVPLCGPCHDMLRRPPEVPPCKLCGSLGAKASILGWLCGDCWPLERMDACVRGGLFFRVKAREDAPL